SFFNARGAPPLALARRRGFAALPSGASLGPQALPTLFHRPLRRRLVDHNGPSLHFSMLAGPHPRSLSLGVAASPRFPPAPRSRRRRYPRSFTARCEAPSCRPQRRLPSFFNARGAPPPLALARRRGFAALPSGASLGPQALPTLFHRPLRGAVLSTTTAPP